jgi:hypothetical protein
MLILRDNAPMLVFMLALLMPYVVWATAGIERLTPFGYDRRPMLGMLRFGAVIWGLSPCIWR